MLTKVACVAPQIFLLGNALTLLRGCPWELMHDWVVRLGPVVHVQIASMSFVLVGSAEGVRRVFQTGALLINMSQQAGSSPSNPPGPLICHTLLVRKVGQPACFLAISEQMK